MHIVFKTSTGIRWVRLLPDAIERKRDGVVFDLPSMHRFVDLGVYVLKGGRSWEDKITKVKQTESCTLSVPIADYDNDKSPEGWKFLFTQKDRLIQQHIEIIQDDGGKYISHREMPFDEIFKAEHELRWCRAAHRDDTKELKIDVDMEACREVVKGQMREWRKPLLLELDVEYQRAHEAGDPEAMKAVVVQKQALRDCTKNPRIAEAKTPEELKTVMPQLFGG